MLEKELYYTQIAMVSLIAISIFLSPFIVELMKFYFEKRKHQKKCQKHKEMVWKGLQDYLVQAKKRGRVNSKNLSKESLMNECFFNVKFSEDNNKNKKEKQETSESDIETTVQNKLNQWIKKLIIQSNKIKPAQQNSIQEYGDLKTAIVILNKMQELQFIVTNKKAINEDTFDTQFAIQYPQDNLDIHKNKLKTYTKNKYKFKLCSIDFNNFLKYKHFFYFKNLSFQSYTYQKMIYLGYKTDFLETILKNADIEFNQDNISHKQCEIWNDFKHEHAKLEVDFDKLFKKNKFQKVKDWLWAKENKLPELVNNKLNYN